MAGNFTEAAAYKHLYQTKEWKRLSLEVKVRDEWTCQKCDRLCTKKGQAIADHKIPHKGDEKLFFDINNLWCLCNLCHDTVKRVEENGIRMQRTDGW